MVDSIKSIGSTPRPQSAQATASLRNNPLLLDSIVKTQQQNSGTRTALAVPQSAKSGASSSTKLPRGSLVDLLT